MREEPRAQRAPVCFPHGAGGECDDLRMRIIARLLVIAAAVWIVAAVVPGVHVQQGVTSYLIIAVIFAALAAVAGSQYNVYAQLNLPRIPVDEGDVTAVGLIAIAAAILTALIGALLGGLAGMRFHRKVDAEGLNSR